MTFRAPLDCPHNETYNLRLVGRQHSRRTPEAFRQELVGPHVHIPHAVGISPQSQLLLRFKLSSRHYVSPPEGVRCDLGLSV